MGKCAQIPFTSGLMRAMEGRFPPSVLRIRWWWWGVPGCCWRNRTAAGALRPDRDGGAGDRGGTHRFWLGALIARPRSTFQAGISFLVSSWLGLLFPRRRQRSFRLRPRRMLLIYPLRWPLILAGCGHRGLVSNVTQDLTQLGRPLEQAAADGPGLSSPVAAGSGGPLPPLGGFWCLATLVGSLWWPVRHRVADRIVLITMV